MKVITSPEVKPPTFPFYVDDWERSLDPWHKDAFPDGLKWGAPNQGEERASGWMALDWVGNPLGFVPDGTEYEVPDEVSKE